MSSPSNEASVRRSAAQISIEVFKGQWGNGQERVQRLTEAGYDYKEVQALVNQYDKVAKDVIRGAYGNGSKRVEKLRESGYDPRTIQQIVNLIMSAH